VSDRTRTVLWGWAFAIALVVQVYALYRPEQDGPLPFPGADKVVHATLFAAPMLAGVLAGIPARLLAVVLVAHAALSEAVQAVVLPQRSGDPLDALADIAGVLLVLGVLGWGRRFWGRG
jgi:hypothetical protein